MRIAIDADQVLFDFDGAWRTTAVDTPARKLRQQAMDDLGLRRASLVAVGSKGGKYHALKGLRPVFFADDLWKHCQEAIDAGVPHVVRVSGGHDGDGAKIAGVMEVDSLEEVRHDRFDRVFAAR